MATATSSRLLLAVALVAALAIAGCGGAAGTSSPHGTAVPASFSWLQQSAPADGWRTGALPSGTAHLAYPLGWRPIRTDPGTFSAALVGPRDRIRGYLNVTPRSGAETLANWSRFRPAHNADEGDRKVVREAAASGLRFRTGTGSCVVDRYATATGARYREIACIVKGSHGTNVVVAAAAPAVWPQLAPQLKRAVASFTG